MYNIFRVALITLIKIPSNILIFDWCTSIKYVHIYSVLLYQTNVFFILNNGSAHIHRANIHILSVITLNK